MIKKCGIYLLILVVAASCSLFTPKPIYDNVPLRDYEPFTEKTKVAVLNTESTLKLESDLPIVDGATALYPLYAAFVQATYPEAQYPYLESWGGDYETRADGRLYQIINPPAVAVNGTSKAYNNLINGDVDLIFCAGPSYEQLEKARENGVTLCMTPIGKEAFVFFVNKQNKVSCLTTDQIRDIYSGKITNWSDVGGKKNSIKVYQRKENSGSQTMLKKMMGDEKIIEPLTEEVMEFMGDIVTEVSAYRNYNNAIGYSFLFYTTQMVKSNQLKLLKINGIYPSKETIQTNEYPYSDVFFAITTTTTNENVNKLVEWILSEQGQYLVERTGYVPIK